jgi:putative tricarboxylic transport membrane protein
MPPTNDTAPPPGESTFASVLLLLSGFLLWSAHGISGFASTVSAGAFPMGAAAVMVVCALMFVHRAARRPDTPDAPAGWRRIMPPVLLWNTLALAGYMFALERAGFHLASLVFLLLSMRLLGSRRWGLNVAVAVGAVAAIHLVFQTVFSVVLPAGTLWQD